MNDACWTFLKCCRYKFGMYLIYVMKYCSCTHYPMHIWTGYFVKCKLLLGILVIGLDFVLSLAISRKFVSSWLPTLLWLCVYNWDTVLDLFLSPLYQMELKTLFRKESVAEPFFVRIQWILPSFVPKPISVASSVPIPPLKSGGLEGSRSTVIVGFKMAVC